MKKKPNQRNQPDSISINISFSELRALMSAGQILKLPALKKLQDRLYQTFIDVTYAKARSENKIIDYYERQMKGQQTGR